ncbi:hypothetical protein [Nocardioides sp.]|uniref:hypothetical protein n=1 Tax=Nocardioides sp. TaxID=35761 RepID=UPI002ED33CBB
MSSQARSPETTAAHETQLGGTAGVVAAALFVLTTILTQLAPIGTEYESATDYLHQVALALAYVGVLIALVGLHARQRSSRRYGRLGGIGTTLTLVGYGVVLGVVVAGIIMGSKVLTEPRIAAALVVLVGSALLGVATLRARVVPWWCGVLLIIAFPLGDVANRLFFDGAEALLLAMLWGSIGTALLKPTSGSQAGQRPEVTR